MYILGGFFFVQFVKRLNLPFVQLFLEEKNLKVSQIATIVATLTSIYGIFTSVNNLLSKDYLFDLALKYKEDFATNELRSENCEKLIE